MDQTAKPRDKTMWKIGQKLVCLGHSKKYNTNPDKRIPNPVKGEIYTFLEPGDGYFSKDFICLVEFGNRWNFDADRFRPVDETFGEWVEETVMKEAEYAEAIEAWNASR